MRTGNRKFLTRVVCRAKEFREVVAGASFQLLAESIKWQNLSPRKQNRDCTVGIIVIIKNVYIKKTGKNIKY